MSLVKRFQKNMQGNDFAVGDIHGSFSRLQQALNTIGFNPERDRLFSVGDLVDRGPESGQFWDWLDQPWFFAVQGNHEDMAIRWPEGNMDQEIYLRNGGEWNLKQSPDKQRLASNLLSELPVAIEVETSSGLVGIVHADVPGPSWAEFVAALDGDDAKTAKRATHYAQWSRGRIDSNDCSRVMDVLAVVVGHTPLENPRWCGNVLHIDTGAWLSALGWGRKFTFANLETLETISVA